MARPKLRSIPSEEQLPNFFNRDFFDFPLKLDIEVILNSNTPAANSDGIISVKWEGRNSAYIFEYRKSNTPKALEDAALKVEKAAERTPLNPMVVAPYLDEEKLATLSEKNISGLDLCGNASLISKEFAIWRTGQPNLYKSSKPLRNVFRGRSSIFARCFLMRSQFESLTELSEFAQARLPLRPGKQRDRRLTLSTASKVVKVLEQELLVSKANHKLKLLEPERLLDELLRNHESPRGKAFTGKTSLAGDELWSSLKTATAIQAVATGAYSAARYGVLGASEKLTLYVRDLSWARERLSVKPSKVFPNIQLLEASDDEVYFDCRIDKGVVWASPIQTWLELATGGPRERQAASEIKTWLIREMERKSP